MLRYLTAGESHGPELTVIVEGFPSRVKLSREEIDRQLWRRQQGYGRGRRMQIESDTADISSGVRFGETLGTPITIHVANRDFKNWQERMSVWGNPPENIKEVLRPRPGHADLAGGLKYEHEDLRNVLERASARNTATQVAVGALASQLLKNFDIQIVSHVVELGGVSVKAVPDDLEELGRLAEASVVRVGDASSETEMIAKIDEAKANGDTVGGVFEIVIRGLPVGLGSYVHPDRKLDGRLAGAMMSIQAIKGVEIGLGFEAARRFGSNVHDPVAYDGKSYFRPRNGAGGLEGGVTTGQDLVVRVAMKPISTLYKALPSVNMRTKEVEKADVERSDYCAVPAAAVVGENVAAFVLADAFLEKFGGDSLPEIEENFRNYQERVLRR